MAIATQTHGFPIARGQLFILCWYEHCAMNRTAVVYALLSAALFGVSTPAAKFLVGSIHPVTLAGLLYCGAGVGLAVLKRFLPSIVTGAPEVAVSRAELPWLAGAIGAGGVLGPLLLMFGLSRTEAATASLLLTLEGAATALIAWFIFHEIFDRRVAVGMASLVALPCCRGPVRQALTALSAHSLSLVPVSRGGWTTI